MKYNVRKLERARKLKGWNKAKLAKVAGVDPSTVGHVETEEFVTEPTVKKLADALGLSMEEVLLEERPARR